VTLQLRPVSSATAKGQRSYQEDRLFTLTGEQGTLLAVFDGHGGAQVSHLASEELPGIFADLITEKNAKPRQVLKKSIHKLNIMTQHFAPGSTISLAFIPFKKRIVYCAVMGDSPILIKDSKGNINISPDHNVRTNEAERIAALDRGGFTEGGYLYATFTGPGLQMARALGDAAVERCTLASAGHLQRAGEQEQLRHRCIGRRV
jgi:serine/threonine protein phosphatase PrpC